MGQYFAGPIDLINDGACGSNPFCLACFMGSGSIADNQQLGRASFGDFRKNKRCRIRTIKNNEGDWRGQYEFAHASSFLKYAMVSFRPSSKATFGSQPSAE